MVIGHQAVHGHDHHQHDCHLHHSQHQITFGGLRSIILLHSFILMLIKEKGIVVLRQTRYILLDWISSYFVATLDTLF